MGVCPSIDDTDIVSSIDALVLIVVAGAKEGEERVCSMWISQRRCLGEARSVSYVRV